MLSSAPWAILPDRLLELSAAAPRLTAMAAPSSDSPSAAPASYGPG